MTWHKLALLTVVLCLAGCAAGDRTPPRPPTGPGPVVVTLGDSVPAGTACGCTPFPDLYAETLSPKARSLNLARPGYTATDVETQIGDGHVRDSLAAATVVLVMAGANDMADVFGEGDDTYPPAARKVEATMARIVTEIRQDRGSPVRIVVLGYWNVVKDGPVALAAYGTAGMRSAERATRDGDDALRRAAEQSGALYLSTGPAFKGGDLSRDPGPLLTADGDHPNAAGHEAIAALLAAAVPAG